MEYSTDTATLAIFDPEQLMHRKNDDGDWWTDPYEEIDEVNAGKLFLVGLLEDGKYFVDILEDNPSNSHAVSANIKCSSGELFIGPGEEIPGAGYAPFARPLTTGRKIEVDKGVYEVTAFNLGERRIGVRLIEVKGIASNSLKQQLIFE